MKNKIARYNLATITTINLRLIERRNTIKKLGFTDEQIYVKGMEFLEQETIEDMKST